ARAAVGGALRDLDALGGPGAVRRDVGTRGARGVGEADAAHLFVGERRQRGGRRGHAGDPVPRAARAVAYVEVDLHLVGPRRKRGGGAQTDEVDEGEGVVRIELAGGVVGGDDGILQHERLGVDVGDVAGTDLEARVLTGVVELGAGRPALAGRDVHGDRHVDRHPGGVLHVVHHGGGGVRGGRVVDGGVAV